jgi:hypothetical protein
VLCFWASGRQPFPYLIMEGLSVTREWKRKRGNPGLRIETCWCTTYDVRLARSRNCSKQRANACGHRHGQRAPECDADCADRHACAAHVCGQPA